MARVIGNSDADLAVAAASLKEGRLVAFPTETVYGLGANALSAPAAQRIFEVKGRPASDPLIGHVLCWEDAEKLVRPTDAQRVLARALAEALWPGPLTLVLPAAEVVPALITAQTGWVGLRSPRHETARRLLAACGLCLAAPSANLFNHVSPTLPQHVMADLAARDDTLMVVDGGASDIGIESTVAKVHPDGLEVLRRGAVSLTQLRETLSAAAGSAADAEAAAVLRSATVRERDTVRSPKRVSDAMEGPGQMLTHYAPNLPCFLLREAAAGATHVVGEGVSAALGKAVLLDFGGVAHAFAGSACAYRDLSPAGSAAEAAAALFDTLRWAECVEGAEVVVVPLVDATAKDELALSVQDRLFRSASGRSASLAAQPEGC